MFSSEIAWVKWGEPCLQLTTFKNGKSLMRQTFFSFHKFKQQPNLVIGGVCYSLSILDKLKFKKDLTTLELIYLCPQREHINIGKIYEKTYTRSYFVIKCKELYLR